MPISEVMSKPLLTITNNSSLKESADLMQQNNIRKLLVLDSKGKLVGIVTAKAECQRLDSVFSFLGILVVYIAIVSHILNTAIRFDKVVDITGEVGNSTGREILTTTD
jgi:CBS-domain-containing membrane protein